MDERAGSGRGDEGRPSPFADLLAVGGLAALTLATVATLSGPTLRAAVSLPLFAFGPGYALLACVESSVADSSPLREAIGARSRPQRLTLVAASSLVIVSALGVSLALLPTPTTHVAVTAVVAAVTLALAAAAAVRRRRRDADSSPSGLRPATDESSVPPLLLALTAVFLVLSLGYAALLAPAPDGFTSLSVHPPGEDAQASIDSLSIAPGEETTLVVGVRNHEGEPTNYTVVARTEYVEGSGENATVLDRTDARRFEFALAHEESWRTRHAVAPERGEGRIRVAYYLYRGQAPPTATEATAYRTATVWESDE